MPVRNHVPPLSILRARKRALDAVRGFFDRRGFLEVETPILVDSPGLELHLTAFETTEHGPDRRTARRYLHTSPEYAMKRLLGRGTGSIYQLARVFRDGERSRTHAPEFTMLEWYRSPGDLEAVMEDTEMLVRVVADAVDGPWRPAAAERISVSGAFERAGLGDPLSIESVPELQGALEVRAVDGDTWEDVFFRAFLEHIEPKLDDRTLTLLFGYPARMAALARLDPLDARRAERFEAFAGDLELANAFGELTDPVEQRARFERERAERARLGRPLYPIDEGLLSDLAGVHEAAGVALGFDRLLMKCLGAERIQDVLVFSPRDD